VAPRMISRNINVKTTSATRHAINEYPPGECAAYPLEANPPARSKTCFAAGDYV
jgi:hypothetical protein